MGKSSGPKPPDPKDTSAAQTGTNIGTAIANNTMGMVDQITPDGSLTYSTSGNVAYTDPYTGKVYNIPKYTATTQLSQAQQAIKDQNNTTQLNLAETGANQSAFLKDYLAQPGVDSSAAAGMHLGSPQDRHGQAHRSCQANQTHSQWQTSSHNSCSR